MTHSIAVGQTGYTLAVHEKVFARLSVVIALGLARLSPDSIQKILLQLRRGARPATVEDAQSARNAVLTVSVYCRGATACLPRSLAAALLCRLRGSWADWCVGVRAAVPLCPHAWIEAEGRIIDEFGAPTDYHRLIVVPTIVTRR